MNVWNRQLAILGEYVPNNDKTVMVKDMIFLQTPLNHQWQDRRELILNCRTGKRQSDVVVRQFGENEVNDFGERPMELCKNNELKIMNGFFSHKTIHNSLGQTRQGI